MAGVLLSGAPGWNIVALLHSQAEINFRRRMTLSLFSLRRWRANGPSRVEDAGLTLILEWFFFWSKLTIINVYNRSSCTSERTQRNLKVDLETEFKTGESDSETSDVGIIKIQGFSNLSNQSEQSWESVIIKSCRRILPRALLKQLPIQIGRIISTAATKETRIWSAGILQRRARKGAYFNLILVLGSRVCTHGRVSIQTQVVQGLRIFSALQCFWDWADTARLLFTSPGW